MQYCIFEDTAYSNFLPLVYIRPVFELRCGVLSLREKLEAIFPSEDCVLLCRSNLAPLLHEENPDRIINTLEKKDTWFVNGRLLPNATTWKLLRTKPPGEVIYKIGNEIALAFMKAENVHHTADALLGGNDFPGISSEPCDGAVIQYPWDLIHHTREELAQDFLLVKKTKRRDGKAKVQTAGAVLINKKEIVIGENSVIKPGVVLDAEAGPIIIGDNVTVMSNAVIEGPACVGDHSIIKIGAKIYGGTSIGIHCKVGGEVEASVIHSFSNKQHEGFLGHSYVGSWVNLGADTNTSDLKNTYGTIRVRVNGTMVDTGQQFVGLMIGDHSKSGINTTFDTGSVVGIACNVFGAKLLPKFLPSFSWGGEGKLVEHRLEKSLETARRVMMRRNVRLTESYERIFREIFDTTAGERRTEGIV